MKPDITQLDRSFPFSWIAKAYGVPYRWVIGLADGYDQGVLKPPVVDNNGVFTLIYRVCKAPWRWQLQTGSEVKKGLK